MKAYFMNDNENNFKKEKKPMEKKEQLSYLNFNRNKMNLLFIPAIFARITGSPSIHVSDEIATLAMTAVRDFYSKVDKAIDELDATLAVNIKGEYFNSLRNCPLKRCTEETVEISVGSDRKESTIRSEDGNGSKSIPVSLEDIIGRYSRESLSKVSKGRKARGNAKDPLLYDTYKHRVSVHRSTIRALKYKSTGEFVYSEQEVDEITRAWTESYNLKFGTSFEPYFSERKYSPLRDGKR